MRHVELNPEQAELVYRLVASFADANEQPMRPSLRSVTLKFTIPEQVALQSLSRALARGTLEVKQA